MALSFIFKADGAQYARGLEKMRSNTQAWAGGIGKMIAGAFAVTAAFTAIKKLITSASELSETMSKSRVIFKQHAEEVSAWAGNMATSFGQSKSAALDAAATFSSMFNILGVGETDAIAMSKRLVELASDMASFNNTSVEDAIAAIGSGLRGEAEPLRKFNVLLNDATLKAKAMELGLFSGKGALDLQTKSLAAYEIILEQSSVANNDFANTSDEMANSLRIMKAEATNAAAEIGDSLIPAVNSLVGIWKAAKILFTKDTLGIEFEVREKKNRSGGVQRLVEENLDDPFSREELDILSDTKSTTEDLDRVMRNHGKTIFDLHLAVIDFAKAEADIEGQRAQATADAAEATKEQIKQEKELAKEQEKRIKRLEQLRKTVEKDRFDVLSDDEKLKMLEAEKEVIQKTIQFQETHKPAEGEEDIAEERELEARKRLAEINRQTKAITDKRTAKAADQSQRDVEDELESFFGGSEGLDAREKELNELEDKKGIGQQTGIVTTSLAASGLGGNTAAFTGDPALSESKKQTAFLDQIAKNTMPPGGTTKTPEI